MCWSELSSHLGKEISGCCWQIQLLAFVGLRSPFSCWLSAGRCSQPLRVIEFLVWWSPSLLQPIVGKKKKSAFKGLISLGHAHWGNLPLKVLIWDLN